jgi:hypothetical protein
MELSTGNATRTWGSFKHASKQSAPVKYWCVPMTKWLIFLRARIAASNTTLLVTQALAQENDSHSPYQLE